MNYMQNVQWFPGHMAKAKRNLLEDIKKVDLIAEILDARIPVSSKNPEFDEIAGNKKRLLILNKKDLANDTQTARWLDFFTQKNISVCAMECKKGKSLSVFYDFVCKMMKEKTDLWKSKGMIGKKIKVMIVGIPNVGKSSLINKLSKKNRAKFENKPGVTRNNQWYDLDKNICLLDTPGVLWPKFENQKIGINLALVGSIKEIIFDNENLALELIDKIITDYPEILTNNYNLDNIENLKPFEILKLIGKNKGRIMHKNEIDLQSTAKMILNDFKNAKLGKITLETI